MGQEERGCRACESAGEFQRARVLRRAVLRFSVFYLSLRRRLVAPGEPISPDKGHHVFVRPLRLLLFSPAAVP